MAHKEIAMTDDIHNCLTGSSSYPSVDSYNDAIREANDLLLYRKLDECLKVCRQHISIAKNYMEDSNSSAALESLMVIAIQAYAELNRSQEVIPYITQIYNGLEDCPVYIVKLCMLLHLRLNDRVTCSVIAGIWLRNAANSSRPGYLEVVDLYLDEVLIPGACWDGIKVFLDSLPGLDGHERDSRMRKVQNAKHQLQMLNADRIEVLESGIESNQTNEKSSRTRNNDSSFNEQISVVDQVSFYLTRLTTSVLQRFPRSFLFSLSYICAAAAFIYIVITKWRSGALSSSPVFLRLRLILVKLWRGMFAPFYEINR